MDNSLIDQKLTWREKIFFGIGPIGKNLSSALIAFLPMYFMGTLGLKASFFATMLFIARIWDGVNDLMMGTVIDNTKSRMGKFRPWILIGTATNAFIAIMAFWTPDIDKVWLYVYATIMFLLHDLTFTMVDVGYWALIPSLTLDPKERGQVSLIPRLVGALGGIVGTFSLTFVEKLGGEGVNQGYFKFSLICSAAYMLTMTLSALNVKEKITAVDQVQEPFSLKRALKILFKNDQALAVVGIMILFNVACNLTNEVSKFFIKYVLRNTDAVGMFGMIIGGARGIGLFGFSPMSAKIGRDKMQKIAYLAPCVGYLLFVIFNMANVSGTVPIYIAGAVTFITFGCMDVMQGILLADAVDYGEWKSGERNEGIIFSMLTLLSKFAGGITSLIQFGGFALVNFDANNETPPTPDAVTMIKVLMYVLPPLFLIGAYLVHRAKFRLNPELMAEITQELKDRRRGQEPEETAVQTAAY